MGLFSSIPVRSNGAAIPASAVNSLRTAGMALEAIVGGGSVASSQAIANNQSTPADIAGLLFSSASVGAAFIDFRIRRKSTSVDLVDSGSLKLTYLPGSSAWDLSLLSGGPHESGVTFSVTALGQIQYVSTNEAGTYDTALSKIVFSARTVGV